MSETYSRTSPNLPMAGAHKTHIKMIQQVFVNNQNTKNQWNSFVILLKIK